MCSQSNAVNYVRVNDEIASICGSVIRSHRILHVVY